MRLEAGGYSREIRTRPADDPLERGGCPSSVDRMVPPLRGASPSASLTASPGATRLGRVPECRHQVEPATASFRAAEGAQVPIPSKMARRYGPETPVPDWRNRQVCSRCGSRAVDMVVTGERR
jgi:hypothetical protein